MRYAIPVTERVAALRQFMAERAAAVPPTIDSLQSVFLIGSCSQEIPDDWYQDYDIHFLFDSVALRPDTLHWLRHLLQECERMSDETCRITTFVRDRHWKMVPDKSHRFNIGIHATLLNRADHFRRLHYTPLLALNMYRRCYLLYGQHPAEIRGWRPPQLVDYAISVGGIGWMAENFARAVTLYLLQPEDHSFYPFIAGYCWNVASTLMFHLYTLEQGSVTGRRQALEYFLARDSCGAADRSAAELLAHEKENPEVDATTARELINAAGRVLTTIRLRFWQFLPQELQEISGKRCGIFSRSCLYERWDSLVGEFAGEPPIVVDLIKKEDPDDYLGTVEEALGTVRKEYAGRLSPKENFEFLRDLLVDCQGRTKTRIWDMASLPRRLLSHDFHAARKLQSADGVFFGWEDGVQALLQRLHEVYIEKGTEDAELLNLALICNAIVAEHLSEYAATPWQLTRTPSLWHTTSQFSRVLQPLLPIETRGRHYNA